MQTFKEIAKAVIQEFAELKKNSSAVEQGLTPDTVYQQGRDDLRAIMNKDIIDPFLLPGSELRGIENLYKLLELAKKGGTCLIMAEHYSNLDLPEFFYFLDKAGPEGRELADSLVAIAGMKLSLEDPNVALFASIYSRIVICPSRTLSRLNPEQDKDKIAKIKAINLAAARKLNEIKTQGKIMLVYPTGTRYRPWEPDSKRAVREVDSYVKGFDWVCFVAKTGLILRVRQETEHNMLLDYVTPDTVRFTVSGPVSCAGFRSKARLDAEERGVEDKKQAVADAVMEKLEEMHRAGNPYGAGG